MEPVIFEPEDLLIPFVNEECGDTLWDEVLTEAEAKDKASNH